MRVTQIHGQEQAMVVGDLGVPDLRNYYDFAASDYFMQSVGEMYSIANILDQLNPSVFGDVTGLSPIMELNPGGMCSPSRTRVDAKGQLDSCVGNLDISLMNTDFSRRHSAPSL